MRKAILAVLLAGISFTQAWARDLKASLPFMPPVVESPEKGWIVDFVKALGRAYTDGKISIEVFPFARALLNIESGRYDFEAPLLENPATDKDKLRFRYSTETIFQTVFVLYTNKEKPIDAKNLGKYTIETDIGHVEFFPFHVVGSASIDSSLKKLATGRIDGFLFAQPATDPVVNRLNLESRLEKTFYRKFNTKMTVPKGPKGDEVDKILSELIKKLRANGEYEKTLEFGLHHEFTKEFLNR